MYSVAVIGAHGRMGKALCESIHASQSWQLAHAITSNMSLDVIWKNTPTHHPCVIIDFSTSESTYALARYAYDRRECPIPLLICTTGLSDETCAVLRDCSQFMPVMIAPNTSVGIIVLRKAIKIAASLLTEYDITLIDTHHRHKKDAPSGTAKSIRETLARVTSCPLDIHSIRAGDHIASHAVSFHGTEDTFSITHTAHSRHVFARGALMLAQWLMAKGPGLYEPINICD